MLPLAISDEDSDVQDNEDFIDSDSSTLSSVPESFGNSPPTSPGPLSDKGLSAPSSGSSGVFEVIQDRGFQSSVSGNSSLTFDAYIHHWHNINGLYYSTDPFQVDTDTDTTTNPVLTVSF